MIKKTILILFCVIICLTINGCWDRKELDQLSIVSGLAIDNAEQGYLISVQVIVPSEVTGQGRTGKSTVRLFQEEGQSLFQAIRKLTKKIPRKGYFAHLMCIVISEELAKENILEIVDFLLRDPEIRPDVQMYISKDVKARDILKVITHIENIPANKVKKTTINAQHNWSALKTITLLDLVKAMASKGMNPVLYGATIIGDKEEGEKTSNVEDIESPATIELKNYAVFKNSKLIGWLDESDIYGLNFILGEVNNTIITIPCNENNTYNLETLKIKSKYNAIIKNKIISFNIDLDFYTNAAEIGCEVDLKHEKHLDELENKFEEYIIDTSFDIVYKLQKDFGSDIIGLGEVVHRKYPDLWKDYSMDWNKHFESVEINIKANVEIKRPGTIRDDLTDILKN